MSVVIGKTGRFIRRLDEQYVYPWTPQLALRSDMIECDKHGNPLTLEHLSLLVQEERKGVATEMAVPEADGDLPSLTTGTAPDHTENAAVAPPSDAPQREPQIDVPGMLALPAEQLAELHSDPLRVLCAHLGYRVHAKTAKKDLLEMVAAYKAQKEKERNDAGL